MCTEAQGSDQRTAGSWVLKLREHSIQSFDRRGSFCYFAHCNGLSCSPSNLIFVQNNDNLGELTVNAVLGGCVDPNTHPDDVTGCCPGIKCSES